MIVSYTRVYETHGSHAYYVGPSSLFIDWHNSLWPSDLARRSCPVINQVMNCCRHCWFTINEIFWHSHQRDVYMNNQDIDTKFVFEIYIHLCIGKAQCPWKSSGHFFKKVIKFELIRTSNIQKLCQPDVFWGDVFFTIFTLADPEVCASVSEPQLETSNGHSTCKNVSQIKNHLSDCILNVCRFIYWSIKDIIINNLHEL